MWLFFLGWIAGVVSCLGFGKWVGHKMEQKQNEGDDG